MTTPKPGDRVPCGNPDKFCGRLGGSARCGGCTYDEMPAPAGGSDTERDPDWDNAVEWLLNSRWVDETALTHFQHISTGQADTCEWCRDELRDTQWEKR